jgi:TonB-linked SusC/RagA family outer membrane protein
MVRGTTVGTVTNSDGNFTLGIPATAEALQFSFVGMRAQEVLIEGRTTFTVTMEDETIGIEEVVAVGYGTMRRANLSGAVDQVTSEVLENRTLTNLTQGLQGVMPNVNIRLLDGKPNQAPEINIRGTTSIGQGGSALILIDGVEGDPSMLNPNDIATISVLKDASSAAIYGARGVFGVVLITTKSPVKDKMNITYGANFGIKQPVIKPNFVSDGYTWAKMFNEAFFNWEGTYPRSVNKTLTFSPDYLAELERRAGIGGLPEVEVDDAGNYVYYGSTDWFKELYKESSNTQEHNLTVSGATDRTSFMLTGRYLDQEGLFRYNSDDYRMYNIRAKGAVQVYDWLEITNNTDFSEMTYYNPVNVGEGGGIWRNIADEGHPMATLLNPDGTLTFSSAYTVGDLYYGKNGIDSKRNVFRNTSAFSANFFKNQFRLKGDFTFQSTNNNSKRIRVPIPYSRKVGVIEYIGTTTNDIQITYRQTRYSASNIYGEYETRFRDKHYLKLLGGYNYEQSVFERLMAQRNGLITENAEDMNLALGQSINTEGGYEKWAILGGFYRLNYIFSDRYLIELNGRYDGSSKFPENERYAFFPSYSVAWRVSEEGFWNVSDNLISDLKFRASYGSLGNGNIGSYAFQETFDISQSGRILNGIRPQQTGRPSVLPDGLTWETATTQNIGMDLGMLSGRLQITGDAYIRNTTDMYTIGMTLPAVFGATSPRGNYADLKTTGWEVVVTWTNRFNLTSKPFNYSLRASLADNQSEITRYNNPDKFLNDYYVGQKIGELWGFITEGFFTSEEEIASHADQSLYRSASSGKISIGDIKLMDLDPDGVINPGDNTVDNPGDRTIIGNTAPRYTYGINLSMDWNNFFFSAFFQGVGKRDWYPRYESAIFWGQYNRPYSDIPKWHLNEGMIWSPENPDSFFPRYVSRLANRAEGILRQPQSKYVMNASYIRLKNIQLGYNIPGRFFPQIGLESAKVFVSGESLWTWSPIYKIMDNIDVENATAPSDQLFTSSNAGDGYNYPMMKNITFGISVTF